MKFDPSAFIAAEQARGETVSQPLSQPICDAVDVPETEDFRGVTAEVAPRVADVATVAAPGDDAPSWFRHLDHMTRSPRPASMSSNGWRRLTWHANEIAGKWADKAFSLGWSELDLFGCNPDINARRVDRNGLLVAIGRIPSPLRLVDIDAASAAMADRSGNIMRHYRRQRLGQVPIWHAVSFDTGP